ncbi:hypothetical protein GGR53DRAFT_525780 [Hypoxylon sp. FL1150]|nr:hypothetical protein GGR53DRAFT_525780 [Hypoxylon sp. FL1150]
MALPKFRRHPECLADLAGHPGLQPLLTLHASDDGGIDYTAAYYGCCILAGSIWHEDEGRTCALVDDHPFLSGPHKADREFRVKIPDDDILRGHRYFFHVPGFAMGLYHVVPAFERWSFPDGENIKIPKPWDSL